MDEDEFAINELIRFDTLEEVRTLLGEEPALSRVGSVVKDKADASVNRRVILDSMRSGDRYAAKNCRGLFRPRVIDLIRSVMSMLITTIECCGWSALTSGTCIVDLLVLGFVDAC